MERAIRLAWNYNQSCPWSVIEARRSRSTFNDQLPVRRSRGGGESASSLLVTTSICLSITWPVKRSITTPASPKPWRRRVYPVRLSIFGDVKRNVTKDPARHSPETCDHLVCIRGLVTDQKKETSCRSSEDALSRAESRLSGALPRGKPVVKRPLSLM